MLAHEDLMAFEKRLTEIADHVKPKARNWQIGFYAVSLLTILSAYFWFIDILTFKVTFTSSLRNHPVFSFFLFLMLLLLVTGTHKKMAASSIILYRCREVLIDFNISCDDKGKLILHPMPQSQH